MPHVDREHISPFLVNATSKTGRLQINPSSSGLSATIDPPPLPKGEIAFMWAWLVGAVASTLFCIYLSVARGVVGGMFMVLFCAAFVAFGYWRIDALIYGHDEIHLRDSELVVRSASRFPLLNRVRFRGAAGEVKVWAAEALLGGAPYTIVVQGGTPQKTARVRYALAEPDATRLLEALSASTSSL